MFLIASLVIITVVGAVSGIGGYFLMRRRFLLELERGKRREQELERRVYETAILKEIGDRIGYLLDAHKIIEIISGSLGDLISYSTVSNIVFVDNGRSLKFESVVNEPVNGRFIFEVKTKMLAAFSEMTQKPLVDSDLEEKISGRILDEEETSAVRSFFNLPIVISGKVVGIINVSSKQPGQYSEEDTGVLYRIASQASDAVSRLQEVLESEKGKLTQAVESLSDGLLMVDLNYDILFTNKKLHSLFGLVDNPRTFDVVNALSGKFDLRRKMSEALSRTESLSEEEIVIKDKVLQIFVSKFLDRGKKPIGVIVLFRDITHERALEKIRQDFTAMMVHELRSPLTSIKSTVEFLMSDMQKVSGEDLKNFLTTIDSTSQTMLELVNDLLDVSKMESGKFDVVCESGDLKPIVEERVETFKQLALDKNLRINVQVEPNLPSGWFDKIRIKQVFNNLISNAIKYTNQGEVTVRVVGERVDGNVADILVSVSDSGVGIDRESAEKLFSKYGQLESGRKKAAGKSSGLGLFIAKGIVEASGGKIWVKSPGPGKGSTFYFTVPISKGQTETHTVKVENPDIKNVRNISGFTTEKVGRA